MHFERNELIDKMHQVQGQKTIELCLRFPQAPIPPEGKPQEGEESFYPRRTPKDSELDVNKTILEQFNLLRAVDNERYPAFFQVGGKSTS